MCWISTSAQFLYVYRRIQILLPKPRTRFLKLSDLDFKPPRNVLLLRRDDFQVKFPRLLCRAFDPSHTAEKLDKHLRVFSTGDGHRPGRKSSDEAIPVKLEDNNMPSCLSVSFLFPFSQSPHINHLLFVSISFCRCTRLPPPRLHCGFVPIVLSHSLDHLCRAPALSSCDQSLCEIAGGRLPGLQPVTAA